MKAEVVGKWPDGSVRAVRIWSRVAIGGGETVDGQLVTGVSEPMRLDSVGVSVAETWIPMDQSGVYEDEYTTTDIREPAVYTTLPPEWLASASLRTETIPVDAWSESGWFDEALLGYSRTMVNDVKEAVTEEELVQYEPASWDQPDTADNGSWLFDRASSLWGVYIRTGDVKWLRHAHRASQYYAANIERQNDDNPADSENRDIRGQFRLKDISYVDQKYSYGMPFLLDRWLVGAATDGPAHAEDRVRAISDLIQDNYWEQNFGPAGAYDPTKGGNFTWTERHQAYAFYAHLTAWEYTGDEAYRDKLDAYVAQMVDHVEDPPGGYAADGCLVHDFKHHEWGRFDEPTGICSPWMTALLAEPLWRYYRLTEDERALGLLADFAESVAEYGTYVADDSTGTSPGSSIHGKRVAEYLYSSSFRASDPATYPPSSKDTTISGVYSDREHTCDVAGLVARGVTAGRLLERDMGEEAAVATELVEGCKAVLDTWYRPGDDDSVSRNGPEWRLSPARKYNWWFGTTHDLPRLEAEMGE